MHQSYFRLFYVNVRFRHHILCFKDGKLLHCDRLKQKFYLKITWDYSFLPWNKYRRQYLDMTFQMFWFRRSLIISYFMVHKIPLHHEILKRCSTSRKKEFMVEIIKSIFILYKFRHRNIVSLMLDLNNINTQPSKNICNSTQGLSRET
jgi:hypothetical protein